ncbi:hypothetical protein DRN72_03295, partial [Methanosarcinales archaeon]
FLQGLFQISEDYDEVKSGDRYGMMKISSVSSRTITMKSDDDIGLDRGDEIDFLGDVWFKVADNATLRYYPFVVSEMSGKSLDIQVPTTINVNKQFTIRVVSNGEGVADVAVYYDDIQIGLTDMNGEIEYTPATTGNHTIEARKSGYATATLTINVVGKELTIEAPDAVFMDTPVVVRITSEGEPVAGVNIFEDDRLVGITNETGEVRYTPTSEGIKTIKAEKEGYVTVTKGISVMEKTPFFEVISLDVQPKEVREGKDVKIVATIENSGNAAGSKVINISIDGEVVSSQTIHLEPGETEKVSYVYEAKGVGNHTISVDGVSTVIVVEKKRTWLIIIWALALFGLAMGFVAYVKGVSWLKEAVDMLKARLLKR